MPHLDIFVCFQLFHMNCQPSLKGISNRWWQKKGPRLSRDRKVNGNIVTQDNKATCYCYLERVIL